MLWMRFPGAGFLLLLCFCPMVWPLACNSLFSPIAGDMPKDFSLKVGDPLDLNCTLKVSRFALGGSNQTYEVNGSHLAFKFNESYVPKEMVTMGERSISLHKDHAEYSDSGTYYCNIRSDRVFHVCATQVTVGEKPLRVSDFKCISYYFKNLTCSWKIPQASVRSDYTLREMFAPIGAHPGFPRECPEAESLRTPSSCTWNLSSTPVYRKEASVFHLVLTGKNVLGSHNWSYTVDHLENVKVSEPTDFKTSSVTTQSITIGWKPPEEQTESKKLIVSYKIDYKSQYSLKWEVLHVHNKTSVMVQKLHPYTNYTFRLKAKASKAVLPELWTDAIMLVQETLSDVPEVPPKISPSGYKVQNYQDRRSITLNFETLPKKHWAGASLKYLVECCEDDASLAGECENRTSEVSSITFEVLHRNNMYRFKLWSLNENGVSKVHSNIHVNRYDDMMKAPQDVKVVALSLGVYEVSWRPPAGPSAVTPLLEERSRVYRERAVSGEEDPPPNYTVFWCPRMLPRSHTCNQSLEWRRLGPNTTSTMLELEPEKVYQFAVSAQSGARASEMIWASCVIPVSKELDKINQVSLERDGSRTLLMRWQLECTALKSFVDGYQIEVCTVFDKYRKMALHDAAGCLYSRYKPNSCKVYNVSDPESEEQLLEGLEPNTVYRAVIRAYSNGRLTDDSPVQCARTESIGPAISLVVGVAVGGAVGLTVLVFILYLLARWMKKKVDMIKEIKIQLPDGLDSSESNQMHSYKNQKNGSAHITSEANPSSQVPYGRMGCFSAADHAAPKKRHDSGHSQGSSSSTDELLYKKTRRADTLGRNPSGDSSGGSTNGHESLVSVGTGRTCGSSLCDSGTESDQAAPHSPDCAFLGSHTPLLRCRSNLPKLDEDDDRESQDSGMDDIAGGGAQATPPDTVVTQPNYSKLSVTTDLANSGLQSQLANSEPSLFDVPEGTSQRVPASAPYSKLGLARSSENISPESYSVYRPLPSVHMRGGPPAMPYSQLALRRQQDMPSLFKPVDVTVGLALEQPRTLPHLKDVTSPMRLTKTVPSAGYVTVGQAMKTQPMPVREPSGQGYSKLGIQPVADTMASPTRPSLVKAAGSGYVPLKDMVGVLGGCGMPAVDHKGAEVGNNLGLEGFVEAESSSNDVAIGGGESSNNTSLDDFSFSSTSAVSADAFLPPEESQCATTPIRSGPVGYVAAGLPCKAPFLNGDTKQLNGYMPPTRETQPNSDYVSHNAAFDWGRVAPTEDESAHGSEDERGVPPASTENTNGYVSLPAVMDSINPRTMAVGFVSGVKTGSSSSQVDCSV